MEASGYRQIGATEYVAPVLNRKAFHCPYCNVYAPQVWERLQYATGRGGFRWSHIYRGECFNCDQSTYWWTSEVGTTTDELPLALMVIPEGSANAPMPHADLPETVRGDYEEARSIVDRSPRGAAALLRLAVQRLCIELGESGKKIDDDIAALVQRGLTPGVQKALDSLRVIGNNAVHPGELDLQDDRDTATALFGLLNFIVEQMITRHKEMDAIYETLPESARQYIARRDAIADAHSPEGGSSSS